MENKSAVQMLFPYEPSEFWAEIRKIIQEEVGKTGKELSKKEGDEPLLHRKEIAQKLRISLVTLNDWVKRGLPSHKQRGKVYFLNSEVMDYIKKNKLRRFCLIS
jgi:hypothetical protein